MAAMQMGARAPGQQGKRTRVKYILSIDKLTQLFEAERTVLKEVARRYAFRTNDYYLGLIDWSDPHDPIRRLVIPAVGELRQWGHLDASREGKVTVRKGVQHKYSSTVLLLVNEVCGSFCRYCFRKRLFMNGNDEAAYDIRPGIEYLRTRPEVNNVLLSGGDPMILSTPQLDGILTALRSIAHIRIIRIGSKMPAFNPYRFLDDDELFAMLRRHSQPDRRIYLVCHFDHPRELTPEAREAVRRAIEAGLICVNQNPIIRGVSDDPEVMAELWNELSYMGIPQYYVFQGRPTAGNEPYEVPLVEAYCSIERAKRKCSGLAKRIKFCMSHESGKVEIIGVDHRHVYLKYHRAKHYRDEQRLLVCHRNDQAYWLDQLKPVEGYRNEYYSDQGLRLYGFS
ncbi:MAG TPA: KamA family radical SAM protein [candidate division Zixibacteria bacterium]|nr:KamA family radical SAM protein [candidate division Zixibacteria bacterium]